MEVLDETDGVLAVSEPLKGDGIRLPVSWQSGTDWKPSKDQSVRLKVRSAKYVLYAFEVGEWRLRTWISIGHNDTPDIVLRAGIRTRGVSE